MSIVSAWLLPNGINVEPQFILVDVTDYESFMADLPNHIDWLNDDKSNADMGLAVLGVGDDYAALTTVIQQHDSDTLDGGPQDINLLASIMLDVDEPIIGSAVVLCMATGTSPDDCVEQVGVMKPDGILFEDFPEWLSELGDNIVRRAADTWNDMVSKFSALAVAMEQGVITEEQLTLAVNNKDADMMEMLVAASQIDDLDMDAALNDLLGEG